MQGQGGQDSEKPDPVEDVLAHDRQFGLANLPAQSRFQPEAFYDSI